MAITVPVVNTPLSVSGWGKPITDQVNTNITDIANLKTATAATGWVSLAGANGWSTQISYKKIGNIVYLKGETVKGGGGAAYEAVSAALPVGYRPTADTRYTCAVVAGGAWRSDIISISDTSGIIATVNGGYSQINVASIAFPTT